MLTETNLSVKGQTSIPANIRKMFKLKKGTKILWIPISPDTITIVEAKSFKRGSWAKSLYGKYDLAERGGVEDFLKSKKEDIELEEKHLNLNK